MEKMLSNSLIGGLKRTGKCYQVETTASEALLITDIVLILVGMNW